MPAPFVFTEAFHRFPGRTGGVFRLQNTPPLRLSAAAGARSLIVGSGKGDAGGDKAVIIPPERAVSALPVGAVGKGRGPDEIALADHAVMRTEQIAVAGQQLKLDGVFPVSEVIGHVHGKRRQRQHARLLAVDIHPRRRHMQHRRFHRIPHARAARHGDGLCDPQMSGKEPIAVLQDIGQIHRIGRRGQGKLPSRPDGAPRAVFRLLGGGHAEIPHEVQALKLRVKCQLVALRLVDVFAEQHVIHFLTLEKFAREDQLVFALPHGIADHTPAEGAVDRPAVVRKGQRRAV